MIYLVSLLMLVCFVAENHGKSIKIQIDCDDILKILTGLANIEYKIPDTPFEFTEGTPQVDKNGKRMGNPYHPEDNTDGYLITSPYDTDKGRLPNQWQVKQEIEMDVMKAEIEKQLDRENHKFIAKPAAISEDELDAIDTFNQTTKSNVVTEEYLQNLMQNKNDGKSKLQVNKKENIIKERKKEIEAVAIENNAVHVEKDFDTKDFNMNQKRFQLKQSAEGDRSDQVRIDYSPVKTGMELSEEERAKRPADNEDFKDFQRRFILVDGASRKKMSY